MLVVVLMNIGELSILIHVSSVERYDFISPGLTETIRRLSDSSPHNSSCPHHGAMLNLWRANRQAIDLSGREMNGWNISQTLMLKLAAISYHWLTMFFPQHRLSNISDCGSFIVTKEVVGLDFNKGRKSRTRLLCILQIVTWSCLQLYSWLGYNWHYIMATRWSYIDGESNR